MSRHLLVMSTVMREAACRCRKEEARTGEEQQGLMKEVTSGFSAEHWNPKWEKSEVCWRPWALLWDPHSGGRWG